MFYVQGLRIKSAPSQRAIESLMINCHPVRCNLFLMEGEPMALEADGIEYDLLEEDIVVDSLGDLNPGDLIDYVLENTSGDFKSALQKVIAKWGKF